MSIDQSGKRLGEPGRECCADGLTCPQFLADALENQHVAVNRHTYRQDQARDSRHGQDRPKTRERGEKQQSVQSQCEGRVRTSPAVLKQHGQNDRCQTSRTSYQAAMHRIGAQRCFHSMLLQQFD